MSISAGSKCLKIAELIFPYLRSITGNGVRQTLKDLKEYLPELKITEIPCGTKDFDWTVPDEWNCRDCYIEDQRGN
ncbi:MAG: DUF4910 domain-containing protein, partial [Succinivibrio sp.]